MRSTRLLLPSFFSPSPTTDNRPRMIHVRRPGCERGASWTTASAGDVVVSPMGRATRPITGRRIVVAKYDRRQCHHAWPAVAVCQVGGPPASGCFSWPSRPFLLDGDHECLPWRDQPVFFVPSIHPSAVSEALCSRSAVRSFIFLSLSRSLSLVAFCFFSLLVSTLVGCLLSLSLYFFRFFSLLVLRLLFDFLSVEFYNPE